MSYSKFKQKDLGKLGQLILKVNTHMPLSVFIINGFRTVCLRRMLFPTKDLRAHLIWHFLYKMTFECDFLFNPAGGRNVMASGCA